MCNGGKCLLFTEEGDMPDLNKPVTPHSGKNVRRKQTERGRERLREREGGRKREIESKEERGRWRKTEK